MWFNADITYWTHVWLGIGLLSPWNAFISAADYWTFKFSQKLHTERLITACYLLPNALILLFFILFRSDIPQKLRIWIGFFVFTVAMGIMPAVDILPTTWSLVLMLCLVIACGIADGAAQGALFGEAVCLHPKYTKPLVFGTSISGLVVSLLRVLFKLSLPETSTGLRISSDTYFLTAALICGSCLVLRVIMSRFRGIQEYETDMMTSHTVSVGPDVGVGGDGSEGDATRSSAQTTDASATPSGIGENVGLVDGIENNLRYLNEQRPSLLYVARAIAMPTVSMILIYWITLAIFPGVLAEDVSSMRLGSMYPVILITLFNFFDCIGKFLPSMPMFELHDRQLLLLLSLGRVLFVPAFHLAGKSTT